MHNNHSSSSSSFSSNNHHHHPKAAATASVVAPAPIPRSPPLWGLRAVVMVFVLVILWQGIDTRQESETTSVWSTQELRPHATTTGGGSNGSSRTKRPPFVPHNANDKDDKNDDDDDAATEKNNKKNKKNNNPPSVPLPPNPTLGIVVVDIRTDGILGSRTAPLMQRIYDIVPHVPIELWISNTTHHLENQLGTDLVQALGDNLSFRVMKQNHTYTDKKNDNGKVFFTDLQGITGGHIGKGYALKESKFDIPLFIDTDVYPCNDGFVQIIQDTIGKGTADVLWTLDPIHYGATHDVKDFHVSPEIDDLSVKKAYARFSERNTGTLFAVHRRHPAVQAWLQHALDIYVQEKDLHALRRTYTDQAAFRESFFLHRQELREYLVGDNYGCRFYGHRTKIGCACPCDCKPECVTVHKKELFDTCAGLGDDDDNADNGGDDNNNNSNGESLRRRFLEEVVVVV